MYKIFSVFTKSDFSSGNVSSNIEITEKQGSLIQMEPNSSLSDLVSALNNIGVTPMDLIAILQALSTAGSLQAELEVI